ncbi:MAG: hypothetical protein ABI042_13410 [Verrucomicrobiota bacterium]
MKQIGLAARLWAGDHNDVFPRDLISMTNELGTPYILVCPSDPDAIRVKDWTQFNPASSSYRFMNPSGQVEGDTGKVLVRCPFHGHVCTSDGSVHGKQ